MTSVDTVAVLKFGNRKLEMTLSLLTGVDIILHVVHLGFPLVHLVHDLDMACFGA